MNPSREKQGMHLPRFESGSKIANCEPAAAVLPVLCFLSKFWMFQAGGSHISSNDHHCWRVWVLYDIQNISVQIPLLVHPSFLEMKRTGKILNLWGVQPQNSGPYKETSHWAANWTWPLNLSLHHPQKMQQFLWGCFKPSECWPLKIPKSSLS